MMRCLFFMVFVLGWLNSDRVVAQEIHHIQYALNSPLQTNRVYDVHVAKNGLLYIATDNGFWSYNGCTFTQHRKKGLRTEDITHIQEDKRGRLFFHNFKGNVFIWDHHQEQLYQDTSILSLDFAILDFCVAEDYLYYWNRGRLVTRHVDTLAFREIPPPNGLSWTFHSAGQANFIHHYAASNDTTLQVARLTPNEVRTLPLKLKASFMPFGSGYDRQACVYDPRPAPNGQIILEGGRQLVDLNQCPMALAPLSVANIHGQPWVSCRNGLYLPHLNQHYLKDAYIPKIEEDIEGNIWLASINKGLLKIPKGQHYYHPSDDEKVDVILKHKDQLIYSNITGDLFYWSASQNGGQQFFSNPHKSQIKALIYSEASERYVYSGVAPGLFDHDLDQVELLNFGYGIMGVNDFGWYKSSMCLLYSSMDLREGIEYQVIKEVTNHLFHVKLHRCRNDVIANLRFHIEPKDQFIHKYRQWVVALHQDTLTYVHDTDFDSIRRYTLPPNSQKVRVLNDRIWIEFEDYLSEYNAQGQVLNTIPRVEGLTQNITHISVDANHIAITTKAAIYLYDAQTMQYIHQFNTANGIASIDFDKAWLYEGDLYVNGSNGVSVIALNGNYNKGQPQLWVDKVTVQQEAHEGTTFEYDQNALQIHFAVRSFTTSGKMHWRLKDKAWKVLEGPPQVILEALQHGTYTVEAYFENELGAKSPLCTYQFVIKRPYWLQWWFFVIIGLGIILLSGGVYYIRLQQIQAQNALKNDLVSSQMTALKSQMNPHFIFNALNSIQSLVRFNKNREAYKYINKFALLLRQTLHYSDKDFIPLEQELELLNNYLEMENMRLDGQLDFQIQVVDEALECAIPAMIIQPFVENAIKHGLLHKKTGDKCLHIAFELKDNLLFCTIVDNGVGRAKAKAIQQQQKRFYESFSTSATQKRLALLQQLEHQSLGAHYTDLQDEKGQALGTKVQLTLPIQNE